MQLQKGAFGNVYMATNNATKQKVALKRIPKKLASREDFQREMEALLRIQKWGGHPHIWLVYYSCSSFHVLSMHITYVDSYFYVLYIQCIT